MAGIAAVSAESGVPKERFASTFAHQIWYQQHRGERFSGAAVLEEGSIRGSCREGLFRSNFHMEELRGSAGIGYCGPEEEPFEGHSRFGKWSVCFCGNIINRGELRRELGEKGIAFRKEGDAELIMAIVSQKESIVEGLKFLAEKAKGSYSLLLLTPRGIYIAVSPDGRWPLVLGRKDGKIVVATETVGFRNFGFEIDRDLYPGEIGLLKDGDWQTKAVVKGKIQICSFLWAYTTFPNSVYYGVSSSMARKRLGAALARKDIAEGFIPHLAMPVPDSGRHHFIGYLQEYLRAMMRGLINRVPLAEEHLLRYRFSGRSFTRSTQEKREKEAFGKIVEGGDSLDDIREMLDIFREVYGDDLLRLIISVLEDSVVRGTQMEQNLVPKIRDMGFKEVHIRASFPELKSYCPWGNTTKKGEVLVSRYPCLEDRRKALGVDSLRYNSVDDLVKAIGLPRENLCLDCALLSE